MSIRNRRLHLLSSSALVLLCFTGVAASQTPAPEPPPTSTPPASETPATPAPQTTPEAPPAASQTAPTLTVPTVTVTAPPRSQARTARPAAPARVTTPPPPATTPTPSAAPSATTVGQPAATSPFNQPPASLTTITSSQIQASPAQSFGNLFFTLPGATSAGLAPGASRPVLRGLDDFRVRVQENGIGSMDVSDLGQDHGVPIDPLSIQKIEIFRGPEALRYGSQAVGGVVEATNNRIPVRGAGGRVANPIPGRHDHGRPWSRRRRLVRRRHPRFRHACRLLRPTCQRLFRPELPLSFPDRPRAVRSTASSRTRACIPRGRRWAARTCSTAVMSAPRSRASPASIAFPRSKAHRTTGASTSSRPRSPAKASFVRSRPPSMSCASGWGRSNTSTTSWDSTTRARTAFARPSTITPRRPRPKSSSCRWPRRSAP